MFGDLGRFYLEYREHFAYANKQYPIALLNKEQHYNNAFPAAAGNVNKAIWKVIYKTIRRDKCKQNI